MDGVCRSATKEARMQIAVCSFDDDFFAHETTKANADCGCFNIPHGGIANQRHVRLKLILMRFQKRLERRRPRFLFTFKKQGHFYRELAVDRFISAAGLNKGHQLSFVIGSPTSGPDFATVSDVLDCWLNRIILPKLQRVHRLNIIMSVTQHMRRVGGWAFMMCNNHWMPRRLTK